jgi:GTP-binding protein
MSNLPIRNIAIIAHVDHGKTTLVDHILRQTGTFNERAELTERHMDSMDLEKERGITIQAKNASFKYKGIKVNIVDTPGHSDFGGEVERVLDMVDGAILLCDASEGPLPQTRFVLKKALEQNIRVMVCINKIDRSDARVQEVVNEVFDLFIDLEATEEQADFPIVYAVAREGMATLDPENHTKDLSVLLDMIINQVPAPKADPEGPLQILTTNIGYNNFVGRLAIGRIRSGKVKVGDEVLLCRADKNVKTKVTGLFAYQGSDQIQVQELSAGDIGVVAGFEEINIGDTVTSVTDPRPLPRLHVEEPTVGVQFMVNDSPFAGREGKLVTSRQLKDRLDRELLYNVSIRVSQSSQMDVWNVTGRGELQLGVLFETMRREGYEFQISKPKVIFKKDANGNQLEPMENAVIDVEDAYSGVVNQKLGERRGVLMNMVSKGSGRTRLEFSIPSRGLIGYRSEFLTDTRGTGLLNTQFAGYEEYKGDIKSRTTAAMVSDRGGVTTPYALDTLQERGPLFITTGIDVYDGMIIGEATKGIDLRVNCVREKKLTNHRASGSEEQVKLVPVKPMTLEKAMEWINDRELIEITPKNIRLRIKD